MADETKYILTLKCRHPEMEIVVYSGVDEVVGGIRGQDLTLRLPRGNYTVRTQYLGDMEEQSIRLTADETRELDPPQAYSASPIGSAKTSHEYYTGPAMNLSLEQTDERLGEPQNSSLMLFIRAVNEKRYEKGSPMHQKLSLIPPFDHTPISLETGLDAKWDKQFGSWGFRVQAQTGCYTLRYEGDACRDAAIHIFPHFQTQVFILYHGAPIIEEMRVSLTESGRGFDPNDYFDEALDRGLGLLQNGLGTLPREAMNYLLYGKFSNPNLGLLAAYLLLQAPRPNERLLDTILNNMRNLIPDSPDLAILRATLARKTGKNVDVEYPKAPPQFRAGMDALMDWADDDPDALASGKLSSIATNLYADSPWCTWNPSPTEEEDQADWISNALMETIKHMPAETLSMNTFRKQLNLPAPLIEAAVQRLEKSVTNSTEESRASLDKLRTAIHQPSKSGGGVQAKRGLHVPGGAPLEMINVQETLKKMSYSGIEEVKPLRIPLSMALRFSEHITFHTGDDVQFLNGQVPVTQQDIRSEITSLRRALTQAALMGEFESEGTFDEIDRTLGEIELEMHQGQPNRAQVAQTLDDIRARLQQTAGNQSGLNISHLAPVVAALSNVLTKETVMLFATNRTPEQSYRTKLNRKISFDIQDTRAAHHMYFCERTGKNDYIEIGNKNFFSRLRALPEKTQILLYIHGFNNTGEAEVFPRAKRLQELMDDVGGKDLVHVVPLIWPCDDDSVLRVVDDYWDDQRAADQSGVAFARLLGKFDKWRKKVLEDEGHQRGRCTKRINVLAHSMGNRVFRNALKTWTENDAQGQMPQLFRNVFMAAPDVVNHTLEPGESGEHIPPSARNVVVYYANDDLAMPASKVANLRNRTVSRRLGMTGPEDLSAVPKNVYEVDCDNFNNTFDKPTGHAYFLDGPKKKVSPVLTHMATAIKTGRVSPKDRQHELKKP